MSIPWMDITIGWRDILDIFLVTLLLYRITIMVQGTRAVLALYGLFLIIVFYLVTRPLGLNTITWILEYFFGSIVLIVIIVFQRDIRLALTYMGARQRFGLFARKKDYSSLLAPVIAAAVYMAQRRIGALIVIERSMPLGDMVQGGVELDARVSKELLISIFWVGGPLHDGAVVLRNGKLGEAGCILPLTTLMEGKQDYGTRHRAALGITEETDAIALVVSEERGAISLAIRGKLSTNLDGQRLKKVLLSLLEKSA